MALDMSKIIKEPSDGFYQKQKERALSVNRR